MAAERETKLYECEVKRRRVRAGGGYESFWKLKTVGEAVVDSDTEFRCKNCFGEVKLFRSFDRRNDHLSGDERTFGKNVVKARKTRQD